MQNHISSVCTPCNLKDCNVEKFIAALKSYPGSFATVFDKALSLGSPNFSRPLKVNWHGDFIFDSMILPIVDLIAYAAGPGPGVGAFNG